MSIVRSDATVTLLLGLCIPITSALSSKRAFLHCKGPLLTKIQMSVQRITELPVHVSRKAAAVWQHQ